MIEQDHYRPSGSKGVLDSETTDVQCPFCNHKLRFRQSPFYQGGCYGDTHYHYYCGKCYEYVCEVCNSKMIDETGKAKFNGIFHRETIW